MSSPAPIDYSALAKQHGAIDAPQASAVNYTELAKQHGAINGEPPAGVEPESSDSSFEAREAAVNRYRASAGVPPMKPHTWHPFWEIPELGSIEPMVEKMGQGMGASTGEVVSTVAKGINKVMPNSVQIPKQGIAALDASDEENLSQPEQKAGGLIEDVAQFMIGDEALKGLSYADKLKKIAPVLKNVEAHPRLAKALAAGMRQGTVAGGQTAAHGGGPGDVAKSALLGGGLGTLLEGGSQFSRKFWKPTAMTEAQAASKITEAVNPSKESMTDFTANVTKHVSTIEDYAMRNNIPLDSVDNFTKAAQGAAKEHSTFFYEKLLNPIKDEMVGTTDIPNYGGETLGEGRNVTSLGKLDARLTKVNKMLSPAYAGEGMTNETRQALDAEAAGIRTTLYEVMGKKLGVDQQAIAQVRAGIGELGSIAEQSEMSANAAKHTRNAEAKKPISFNPWHKDTEKFAFDTLAGKAMNAARGDVSNNAVRDAFAHLHPQSAPAPKVEVKDIAPGVRAQDATGEYFATEEADAAKSTQRENSFKDVEQQAPQRRAARATGSTIGEQIAAKSADNEAAAKVAGERKASRQATIDARKAADTERVKADAERAQKNRATHGQWRAAAGSISGDTANFKQAFDEIAPGKASSLELTPSELSKILQRAQELKDGK